jgi:hypothetical protein
MNFRFDNRYKGWLTTRFKHTNCNHGYENVISTLASGPVKPVTFWTHPFRVCYLTRTCNARSTFLLSLQQKSARAASHEGGFFVVAAATHSDSSELRPVPRQRNGTSQRATQAAMPSPL